MGEALAVGLLDGGWEAERRSRSPRSTPSAGTCSRPGSPACGSCADAGVGRGRRRSPRARGEARRRRRRPRRAAPRCSPRAPSSSRSRRGHHRRARSRRARATGRARDAQHRGARRQGRRRDRRGHRSPPTLDLEVCERVLGEVGIVVRVPEDPARRGHRALRFGAGLRVPGRRGDDRGGRARRPRPRHQRAARASDPARRRDAARRRRRDARVAARRGHVTGRHHRGRARGARGPRCARRVPRGDHRRDAPVRPSWGEREPQAAVVATPAQAARPVERAAAAAPSRTSPTLREVLKQRARGRAQHPLRTRRGRRDHAAGRARRTGARLGLPPFPGSRRAQIAGRGRSRLRLGGRRPTRAHRAEPRTDRRLRRRGDARARGRARRRSARVRDRAACRRSSRSTGGSPRAPRAEGAEVLVGRRDLGIGPVGPARALDRPRRGAHRRRRAPRPTTQSKPPRSGCSRSPAPTSSSPTTRTRAWRRRRGSRWWRSPTSTRWRSRSPPGRDGRYGSSRSTTAVRPSPTPDCSISSRSWPPPRTTRFAALRTPAETGS